MSSRARAIHTAVSLVRRMSGQTCLLYLMERRGALAELAFRAIHICSTSVSIPRTAHGHLLYSIPSFIICAADARASCTSHNLSTRSTFFSTDIVPTGSRLVQRSH